MDIQPVTYRGVKYVTLSAHLAAMRRVEVMICSLIMSLRRHHDELPQIRAYYEKDRLLLIEAYAMWAEIREHFNKNT